MSYCVQCGTKLIQKENGIDGMVDFWPGCNQFRFPTFSSAISAVIVNPDRNRILLIQQYGSESNVLVAGYVTKGENSIETLIREVNEEVGLKVIKYYFNDSSYYAKTNTLLNNFVVVVDSENYTLTDEVDHAQWFTFEQATEMIKPHSLAQHFLLHALQYVIGGKVWEES